MSHLNARTFRGEGSDLLIGPGASENAKSGAVSASVNNIYSIFWNPAGLAETTQNHITVSGQLDAELTQANFLALSFSNDFLKFGKYQTAIGFAWLPRLHVKGSGVFERDDFESIFLRFALPGLPVEFDGDIESKTRDRRVTLAISPARNPRWSLGFNIGYIHCKTNFCGVFAEDPGVYKVASVDAKAITFGIGAKYKLNDDVVLGLNIKDINTTLDVKTIVVEPSGTTIKNTKSGFPRDITLGVLWKYRHNLDLTLDYQRMQGRYGTSNINFQLLRGGVQKKIKSIVYRGGILIPLKLDSDNAQDIKNDLPAPFSLSFGIGWRLPSASIDFSIYPNPIMSYTRSKINPSADLSLTYHF
jgi:hypothetical protein